MAEMRGKMAKIEFEDKTNILQNKPYKSPSKSFGMAAAVVLVSLILQGRFMTSIVRLVISF